MPNDIAQAEDQIPASAFPAAADSASAPAAGAVCACGHVHRMEEEDPLEIPDEEILYDLADLFKVFSDTTRIKILYSLMNTERCVADIARAIGASQSAASHQLRILKQARLVKFQRDGKNVIYSLADSHVYTMLEQGMSHICE